VRERHLHSIQQLRDLRERTTAAALAASRAASQNAVNAVTRLESEITRHSALQLQVETSLYEKALANLMTDQQMDEISQRIQEGRQQAGRMSKHLLQLKNEAAKAATGVEAAGLKHAASLRASKKWEKLRENLRKQAALEELRHSEDLSPGSDVSPSGMDSSPC
jgi:hypothetical protein